MKLIQIPLTELLPYIEIAFDSDRELPKYHIADTDYAQHTYDQICQTATMLDLTCYKYGDIGFTVLAPNLLYSFGINHRFRNKKNLESWFVQIKNIMPIFEVALYKKNIRAVNHLLKQGMKTKDEFIVLKYE